MSTTVASVFGRRHRSLVDEDIFVPWPDQKQLIGIEIEAELLSGYNRAQFPPNHLRYWTRDGDGSLINGSEFKLTHPVAGSQLAAAIREFFSPEVRLLTSITSGTHIHLNMDEETTPITAVQTLAALVFTIEPAIYNIADVGRKWGGFTNPMDSAPPALFGALFYPEMENSPRALLRLCESNRAYKYYGLNVQTLGSYGTMEFRYFPTATSGEQLTDWVMLVQSIKLAALRFHSLDEMLVALSDEESYVELLTTHLAAWSDRILTAVPHATCVRRLRQLKSMAATGMNGGLLGASMGPAVYRNAKYDKFFKKKKGPERVDTEQYGGPPSSNERIVFYTPQNCPATGLLPANRLIIIRLPSRWDVFFNGEGGNIVSLGSAPNSMNESSIIRSIITPYLHELIVEAEAKYRYAQGMYPSGHPERVNMRSIITHLHSLNTSSNPE